MQPQKRNHKTNTTRVKIVCYYSHRSTGEPYSIYEMQRSMNRKAHDIYEGIYTEHKRFIVREDLSIKKALRHIEKHKEKIISALIFVNDWTKKQEIMVGKYHKDYGLNFQPMEFTKADLDGNIFIRKLKSIQRDELRSQEIEFTSKADALVKPNSSDKDKDFVIGLQILAERFPEQFKKLS